MDTSFGEITKPISSGREEMEFHGVNTRLIYDTLHEVKQVCKKAKAGDKASTERIAGLTELVKDMAS